MNQGDSARQVGVAKLPNQPPRIRAIADDELGTRVCDVIEQSPHGPAAAHVQRSVSIDQHVRHSPEVFEQGAIPFQHKKELGSGKTVESLHQAEEYAGGAGSRSFVPCEQDLPTPWRPEWSGGLRGLMPRFRVEESLLPEQIPRGRGRAMRQAFPAV